MNHLTIFPFLIKTYIFAINLSVNHQFIIILNADPDIGNVCVQLSISNPHFPVKEIRKNCAQQIGYISKFLKCNLSTRNKFPSNLIERKTFNKNHNAKQKETQPPHPTHY